MAQDEYILPQCIQSTATQAMAAVGCGSSFNCACHSFKFLNLLKLSIATSSCKPADQALAISLARRYCTDVNPSLLDTRTTSVYATNIVFVVLAIAAVVLRFYSRKLARARLGWDDWFVAASLVFALATDALVLVGLSFGGARHSFMNDPVPLTFKTMFATDWVFTASTVLVRFSIIALYMRIFSTKRTFCRILHASAWVVLVLELALVLLYSLSCQPASYFFDKEIKGGHCIDQARILAGSAGIDAATGIWVLILPIPIVRSLQTGTKRKMVLIALFSIGAFTCITAVLRIPFVLEIGEQPLQNLTL